MNRQSGSIKVIVILLVGMLIATSLYYFRPTPKMRPAVPIKPPIVSVITVQPQVEQVSVMTQGTVIPRRVINLVAEVSGRVQSVSEQFTAGGFIQEGDVLVTIDARDLEYRLIEAQAQVAAAERELALEKGQARQAKREWRDLGNQAANALSLREPQVRAANTQLASAKAQRDQVTLNLERTIISAPFTGRVQSTAVDVGQFVTAGSVIASMHDSAVAQVRLPLTDEQVGLIGLPLGTPLLPEQQPQVKLFAVVGGQQREWSASIVRTESGIDPTTRFYFAVAEIEEPLNNNRHSVPLVMGLFVSAEVAGRQFDNVVSVPEKALLNNRSVFMVNDESRLEKILVTVLLKKDGVVFVRGQFLAGNYVVVSDPKVLQDNMQVDIAKEQ